MPAVKISSLKLMGTSLNSARSMSAQRAAALQRRELTGVIAKTTDAFTAAYRPTKSAINYGEVPASTAHSTGVKPMSVSGKCGLAATFVLAMHVSGHLVPSRTLDRTAFSIVWNTGPVMLDIEPRATFATGQTIRSTIEMTRSAGYVTESMRDVSSKEWLFWKRRGSERRLNANVCSARQRKGRGGSKKNK